MKKHNPYTPILIREASGTEPKVFARYEFGKEKSISLKGRLRNSTGLTPKWLTRLRSGRQDHRAACHRACQGVMSM